MFEVTVVVREPGRKQPDYSLPFELPTLPRKGDYISISRPDTPAPWSEDLIVHKVWWRLSHPETNGVSSGEPKRGIVDEIFIECDIAEGPTSSDHWRGLTNTAREKDIDVEYFDVERFSLRQSDLSKGKP